jgi:hypothetical protein
MKEPKSESMSFRLSAKRKLAVMNRSIELGKAPGEYLNDLIEKDLASKVSELHVEQQSFLQNQFNQFTEKLLSFFMENYDKKLLKIEHLSAMSFLFSNHILSQASQTAVREKEMLYSTWKDKAKVDALDEKIKERIRIILEEIQTKFNNGKY